MLNAQTDDFRVFLPLVKVDYQKREVYGRMTQEIADGANEVMDYSSSRPLFERWSQAAKARTALLPEADQSLGNVREMHNPVAVGKLIAIDYNDDERAIDIGTYVADDDAWNKVLRGVLTGFSIGGKYARKWLDHRNPSLTRYTADPVEVSLVDSPSVSTATFKLIKADGTTELHKLGQPLILDAPTTIQPLPENIGDPIASLPGDAQNPLDDETPEDGDLNPSAPPDVAVVRSGQQTDAIPTGAGGTPSPDLIDAARVQPISQPLTSPVAKLSTPFVQIGDTLRALKALQKADDTEAALQSLGDSVGIARRDGESLTQPPDFPSNPAEYGDPANWAYPCDSDARCQSALAYYNGGTGREKYSDAEWNTLGQRIAGRASTVLGARYQLNPQDQTIAVVEETQKMNKTVELAPLLAQLQRTLGEAADQISTDPQAAQAMLRSLVGDLTASSDTTPVSNADSSTPPPAPVGDQTGAKVEPMKADDAGTVPAEPPPETPPNDDSAAFKALENKVDKLTGAVEKLLAGGAVPMQKSNPPAGDLQALLQSMQTQQQTPKDPIMDMLLSGDKYAFQKAAALAGAEGRPDADAVMKKVNQAATESLLPLFTRLMFTRNYVNPFTQQSDA